MKRMNQIAIASALAFSMLAGSALAASDRIAEEGELGSYWTVADGAQLSVAGYPETRLESSANVCLSIGYRVGADGRTSDLVLLDSWNSLAGNRDPRAGFLEAFEKSARAAVAEWRFQPLPGVDSTPTFTVTTFGFMGNDTMSKSAVRSHCLVSDLAAAERRATSRRTRNLASQTLMQSDNASQAARINADNALSRANGN